jgi:hypothetical protein
MDMKRLLKLVEHRKAQLAAHPFFRWIQSGSVPPGKQFDFAPALVGFIMSFRDLNRWFLRYPEPANAWERAINKHTFEDETHSRLFIEDWRKLGLDERLGWRASDAIAWCYAGPQTELFRAHGMELLEMCTLAEDPLVRFAVMEAIEACGHVFFSATSTAASRWEETSGIELRYFGEYHLRREIGHVLAGGSCFEQALLDGGRCDLACELANRWFDMFLAECDRLLHFGDGALRFAGVLREGGETPPPGTRGAAGAGAQRNANPPGAPGHARVRWALEARKRAAREHPLFRWMEARSGHDARGVLRHLALLWAPDIMGYRDLVTYALSYRAPGSERERATNRRLSLLQSHHRLFLHDWAALDMDELLGWKASDTIDFYHRSEHTEPQRQSMSRFVKLACHHPDPLLRFWLIEALEASGEAFFHHTRSLALRVETQDGIRLDYLADRHALAHPDLAPDEQADAVDFTREALDTGGQEIAIGMIDAVFDCLDRQLTHSLELATQSVPTASHTASPAHPVTAADDASATTR